MTVKEIDERVAMLKSLVRDQDAVNEATLVIYRDVLEEVAAGITSPKPESLAKAALGR
jgi:hypothetical protein